MFRKLDHALALGSGGFAFGKIYTDKEIYFVQNQILGLKKVEASIPKNYYFIKKKLVNFVLDYPKLSVYEKAVYKKYKNVASRVTRDMKPLNHKLKWMKMSKMEYRQPTVNDIVEHSKEMNNVPSEAVDHFDKKFPEYAYPPYIIQKAISMNEYHRTFRKTDEPKIDTNLESKIKWFNIAVTEEDRLFGNGSTPIKDEVVKNKMDYSILKKRIKTNETDYVVDVVKDFLGEPTKKFTTADIITITTKQPDGDGGFAGSNEGDESWVSEVCARAYANPDPRWLQAMNPPSDNEMGGFFSKLLKVVLSPVQIFAISPFMKTFNAVASPVLKKVLPARFYGPLSGLTQVSADLLVGKVSKDNIRKAVKYSLEITKQTGKTVKSAAKVVGKAYAKALTYYYYAYYAAMKTSVGKDVDRYTGGIATSYINLTQVTPDLMQSKKIDVKARAIDVIKVGAAVTGGALAVGISAGTTVATEKTGLGKSSLGRGILKAGAVYATGGASTVQDMAVQEAKKQALKGFLKQAVKKGIVNESAASMMVTAGAGASSPQEAAKNFATMAAKNVAVKQVGKVTNSDVLQIVGEAGINAGINAGVASATSSTDPVGTGTVLAPASTNPTFAESFGEGVKSGLQNQAVAKVNDQILASTGINADITDIARLSKGDSDVVLEQVENFGEEELKDFLADQEAKLEQKIENERLKSEMKMNEYQNKYETEKQNLADFDSQDKIDQLEREAQARINEEQKRLGAEMDRIQSDYDKGLDRVKNQITDFDSSKLINGSKDSLADKIAAERDRFQANLQDRFYALTKKYGPQLLAYLMFKYGPQMSYDQYLTQEDRTKAKYWVPPKNGRKYNTNYKGTMIKLLLAGVALYGASKVMG